MHDALNIFKISVAGIMALVLLIALAIGGLAVVLCVILTIRSLIDTAISAVRSQVVSLKPRPTERGRGSALSIEPISNLKEER